jgi:hypothetical protein
MEQTIKRFTEAIEFTFIPGETVKVHIFKPKATDEAVMKLVGTGFFDGTEKFIRLTSTKNSRGEWRFHVYTVIYNDGHSYSWENGPNGCTCVSERVRWQEKIIDRAIELLLN